MEAVPRAFLERVVEAPEGADGAALAMKFAAELDALLAAVVASAAELAAEPATFRLRRAVELTEALAFDEDDDAALVAVLT